MFTGIVQTIGTLIDSSPTQAGRRLSVSLNELPSQKISPGDSICVSGVCLTAVSIADNTATFDVITETLNRTSLGDRAVHDPLNLELSLQPSSFVGGHFVQGHVDAVGTVTAIKADPLDWRITVHVPREVFKYIVPKGSITIEGVSMTIAETSRESTTFTLAVIPTTLRKTTLGSLKEGQRVNLETDILARTVVHFLELREAGTAGATQ